jgi:type I restriction enzyme R subunit
MKAKITNNENRQVLRMNPFGTFRSDYEIVNGIFCGRDKYQEAIQELRTELYKNWETDD